MKSNEYSTNLLTKRQLQVLPFILSTSNYEKAARQAKISPKQIYEWLKDDNFKQELQKRQNEIFNHALGNLKSSVTKAIETLIHLLDSSDDRLRMHVADKIINNACKCIEFLDFEERLSLLENQIIEKED